MKNHIIGRPSMPSANKYGNIIAMLQLEYQILDARPTKIKFPNNEIYRLAGPIVYCWIKDEKYLYIGSSKNGLGRTLAPGHNASIKSLVIGADLEIIPCASIDEARKLESEMILKNNPEFN